jgi:hypothetical protein
MVLYDLMPMQELVESMRLARAEILSNNLGGAGVQYVVSFFQAHPLANEVWSCDISTVTDYINVNPSPANKNLALNEINSGIVSLD